MSSSAQPLVSSKPVPAAVSGGSGGAPSLIDTIRDSAVAFLGSVVGSTLVGFEVGGMGNFPYVYIDPSSGEFNPATYAWINAPLLANTTPAELDPGNTFTTYYQEALNDVSYSLSTADLAKLTAAQQAALAEASDLTSAWTTAFGTAPASVTAVTTSIATTWATPPTTFSAIKSAKNLSRLLNNVPAQGESVVPVLVKYLNAIGGAVIPLMDDGLNATNVSNALNNVESPSTSNGGLTTSDAVVHPAYNIATPLADIQNGLAATSNQVTLQMSVASSSSSSNSYSVTTSGQSIDIDTSSFLSFSIGESSNYFHDQIAKNNSSSNSVSVTMTYTGVTMVNFAPVVFDASTNLNWFWMEPITEAIANGSQDVSGFKFSPTPSFDFSDAGPFGILQGVAIANYPTATIVVTNSDTSVVSKIQSDVNGQSSQSVSFLGVSLASSSTNSYSSSAKTSNSGQTVTITLAPPAQQVPDQPGQSLAWVLGVQTYYPAAKAS